MAKPKLLPGQASTLQSAIKAAATAAGFTLADMAHKVPVGSNFPERDDRWVYNNMATKKLPISTALELYERASAVNNLIYERSFSRERIDKRAEQHWRRIQTALDDSRPTEVCDYGRAPEALIFPGSSRPLSWKLASKVIGLGCVSKKHRPRIEDAIYEALKPHEDVFTTKIGRKVLRAIDGALPLKLVRIGCRPFYGDPNKADDIVAEMRGFERRRLENNKRRAEAQTRLGVIRREQSKLKRELERLEARKAHLTKSSKN